MTKWEYCTVSISEDTKLIDIILCNTYEKVYKYGEDDFIETIVELGIDGWEMCGQTNKCGNTTIFYFKRPIEE